MAKFCEDCPLRGRADGEIRYSAFFPVEGGTTDMLTGRRLKTYETEVGAVLDEHRNPSEPIHAGVEDIDSIIEKLDACSGPEEVEQKRFLRQPKIVKSCPALGRLAIEPRTRLYTLVASETAL